MSKEKIVTLMASRGQNANEDENADGPFRGIGAISVPRALCLNIHEK